MNTILAFSPILALVAFLSAEVAAETLTKYTQFEKGGFVNGFSYKWTVNTETPYTISTAGDMGGCTIKEEGSCPETTATWDNKDTIDIVATFPAGVKMVDDQTPSFIEWKMCFSPPATVNRKWRKINDIIKKDNSCKNGAVARADWDGSAGEISTTMKLKSVTPSALFTIRAFVTCLDQGANQYCHIVNYQTKDLGAEKTPRAFVPPGAGKIFFNTEVMDSRPNNLFVAVIICSLIGPIMLAAFLIYERGVLAKQA